MGRMDKYLNQDNIPMRSDKNKELYKQVYNAYDEFENLIVPSNAKEISMSDLKKEITSREEYREKRDNDNLSKTQDISNNAVIRKEKMQEEQSKEDEIYDINKLIDKAVVKKKDTGNVDTSISNGDYLKKLKLDNRRTNIEQVKEIYEDLKEEAMEEDESLLKTANLSLEILSDLKSDNDKTSVSAPIKSDELPDDTVGFYSNTYKFSKKDFDDEDDDNDEDEEDDEEDEIEEESGGKFFLKILFVVFGTLIMVGALIGLITYFHK